MVKGVVLDGKRVDRAPVRFRKSKPTAKRNMSRQEILKTKTPKRSASVNKVSNKRVSEKQERQEKAFKMMQEQRKLQRDQKKDKFTPEDEDKPKKRKNSEGKALIG
jgi:hypothetical protein